jgi:hypothetical protein
VLTLTQNDTETDSQNPPAGHLRHSNSLQQAVVVQRIVFNSLNEPNLKPAEVSGLARAWCDVNEERRKLRMQPLPRSIDVSKLPKRRGGGRASAAPGPVEPERAPPIPPAKTEVPACPACPTEPPEAS